MSSKEKFGEHNRLAETDENNEYVKAFSKLYGGARLGYAGDLIDDVNCPSCGKNVKFFSPSYEKWNVGCSGWICPACLVISSPRDWIGDYFRMRIRMRLNQNEK